MEILFEILSVFLQFFGEFILQIIVEAIAEIGLHGLREPFRNPRPLHPVFAAVCYLAFGALAGFVSLWFFPASFIKSHIGRYVNVALAPFIAGGAMSALGAWRRRRGEELIRLDRFAYGYLFALAMAVVRFLYGTM